MKITHQSRFEINSAGVFSAVSSLDELDKAITNYGLSRGEAGSDPYNVAVGAAYEVYNQYFCLRYDSNPLLNIKNITDTSLDPYNDGYDFKFRSLNDVVGLLQTKWRGNPQHKFTRGELGTFCSVLREENITPNNSILFTNLRHSKNDSVFNYKWEKATEQMRVFDRTMQEDFILRDPKFWDDFRTVLAESCEYEFEEPPVNEKHQNEMEQATETVLVNGRRGRVVCATGGGKTLIEFRNTKRVLFDLGGRLTIIVAPTRDLVDQHFATFHNYHLFHDGVTAVNFKSGSEPARDDDGMDFYQTTGAKELVALIENPTVQKIHVCSTYKSFPVLVGALEEAGVRADLIIFDEFQHLVSQKVNEMGISDMRQFLLDLPAERILYYSASQKRGRILSSFDEDVFGPLLCDISYKRLRENGILVPKLRIIPVRVTPAKIKGLTASMRQQAKLHQGVDLRDATIEAAGMIVAYEHAAQNGSVNMITWGKKVSHLKAISDSDVVRERLAGVNVHLIHAGIPTRDRMSSYETVRESSGNVILQHSCVSEGVNVVNLNTGYVARRLGTIAMQQGPGGRPTRAHPDDRKKFKAGLLSLDNSEGWEKYSATVYVLVELAEDETFLDFMKDLIRKLQYAGLEESDYEFVDLLEERVGDTERNNDWMSRLEAIIDITEESLEDVIRQAHLDLEEEERDLEREDRLHEIHQMTLEQILGQ